MSHTVFCVKLEKELEGLSKPPFPGDLGEKIYQNISLTAWKLWLAQQTMVINEHRLSLFKAEDRAFLRQQMILFLFGELS